MVGTVTWMKRETGYQDHILARPYSIPNNQWDKSKSGRGSGNYPITKSFQLYLYLIMPTILLVNGFRFFFYSADGDEPIHVHVQRGMGDGKIWLQPEIKIEYMVDFKAREEQQILQIVAENKDLIIQKWNEYFKK
jgi:hypothetical protein